MATKKQRKRRQKERRHEYEIVYVDEEGQEVEVDEPEAKPRKTAAERKPAAKAKAGAGTRTVQPPSWNRTFRRAALFAPCVLLYAMLSPRVEAGAGKGSRAVFTPLSKPRVRRILGLFALDSLGGGFVQASLLAILIFFYITRPKDDPYGSFLLRSLPLLLLIVPFMYMVDSMAYRSYQKRLEKRGGQPPKSK